MVLSSRDSNAAIADTRLNAPAGVQANDTLNRRRLIVLTLNAATWLALMYWASSILGLGGWTAVNALVLVCFGIGALWPVLGFWNAVLGLWLLRRATPLACVAPFLAAAGRAERLTVKTAILMTLRNEDPLRALTRLAIVKDSLERTRDGGQFSYFILSDTNDTAIAAAEEFAVAGWRKDSGDAGRIVYRRRDLNSGFKAGNVRDFCERWGGGFELMLPLDADSLMTGEAIVNLVRIMQANPQIGILQSLVVGTPSHSAFARIFQFGMRLGMRTYTMGQAWWAGDCGPYWGHNAVVRVKPFYEACDLPVLVGSPPLGGPVLSHDQVEAALMRRAGFEVRVMPIEGGSYEDNPPDALEFIRRDVRWCQGNMQYLKLLTTPGLEPVSRFQLLWAILMFAGIPAWTIMIALLPLAATHAQIITDYPFMSAKLLYGTFLAMYLAPKIAGFIDAMLTKGEVKRFGGAFRFLSGAVIELIFSFLQGAVSTIRISIFMMGLLWGRSIVWGGQARDPRGLTWREATEALWPQLAFGIAIFGTLYAVSPKLLLWSLPLTAGYLLAIPFAVVTASPRLGRFMHHYGIAGIPEDFAPPFELEALQTKMATHL